MGKKGRKVGEAIVLNKGSLKRQIRNTERLLSREELPETVRQTKERVLKSLKKELHQQVADKKNKKIHKKYKMVKFFEKSKILRRLKSTVREMSSSTDSEERVGLEESLSRLRTELNYIVHFPVGCKYISLYPSSTDTSEESVARRDKLLVDISERVVSGALPDASESLIGGANTSAHPTDVGISAVRSTDAGLPDSSAGQSQCDSKGSNSEDRFHEGDSSRTDDFFLDVTGNFDHRL